HLGEGGKRFSLFLWASLFALLLCGANDLGMLFAASLALGIACFLLLRSGMFFAFFFGAASLLFGSGILYGLTGSTRLSEIAERLGMGSPPAILAACLLMAGLGVMAILPPFHQWAADVIEEEEFSRGYFLLSVPPLAAFSAMLHLFPHAMGQARESWLLILAACLFLALIWASFLLLAQRSLKGFLAFLSISQFSFAFLGMVALRPAFLAGIAASWIHLLAFSLALAGVAAVFASLGQTELESCQGLFHRAPWLASSLTLCLLSLLGLPPMLGFWGKWFLFAETFAGGFPGLVLLAALSLVIPLYASSRLIRWVFWGKPQGDRLEASSFFQAIAAFSAFASIALFLFPAGLWSLGIRAAFGP
ncbi:MAG TPA: proton-conducting transporter membrane subunit, partial [Chroococcales cyanobacterium]